MHVRMEYIVGSFGWSSYLVGDRGGTGEGDVDRGRNETDRTVVAVFPLLYGFGWSPAPNQRHY